MSSKHVSSLPRGPKPPTTLSPTLTIDSTALLVGTHHISFGSSTIIHPRTKFMSTYAPITVGNNCIIGERVSVGLRDPSKNQAEGCIIEDGVVVEVGAVIEARVLGEGTVVEVGAVVGKGSLVGKHCKISPLAIVPPDEIIPDHTVVLSDGTRRTDKGGVEDLKTKMVGRQVDVLRKLIPTNLSRFQ